MKFLKREEYYEKLWKKTIFTEENCPFCRDDRYLIKKLKFWKIFYNFAPYTWNDRHIMAAPKRHINFFLDLKDEEILELREIQKFAKDFFEWENYFSFTRESIANRSVEHLHIHFVAWKLQWKFLRKMLELQGFPIKESLKIS